MGKARGPRRKEAPARKRLSASNPSNSALLHKQGNGSKRRGTHRVKGLNDGPVMGKRTLSQQFLVPNKRARGGKRRRKGNGPLTNQPGSSDTAAIHAEYAAVDARANAQQASEEARRLQAPARIRLAPPTATFRMPSEGDGPMTALRASSSARIVEALLQSITDDPAPDPLRVNIERSEGQASTGNPFAALQGDSSDEERDSSIDVKTASTQFTLEAGGFGGGEKLSVGTASGFRSRLPGSSGGGVAISMGSGGRSKKIGAALADPRSDEDPDL